MQRLGLGTAAGAALGLLAGWLLFGSESGVAPAASGARGQEDGASAADRLLAARPDSAPDELQSLREALALERELRARLAAEVEDLDARLALLVGEGAEEGSGESGEWDPGGEPMAAGGAPSAAGDDGKPWFDDDRLLALGMDPHEIARIRERWERYTMDKLYLQNERARDDKPRGRGHFMRQLALDKQVQEELGEAAYDAMLFASGEKNRVVITDVLEDSPAADAGIRRGDQVFRYGDRSIFKPWALKQATAQGSRGELVSLWVLRDGEIQRVWVPLGPLGVRLEAKSVEPLLER